MPVYQRILLKLSGEALSGARGYGFDTAAMNRICREIGDVRAKGVQTGIVVGAGNIFRGLAASEGGMDRVTADQMGMLGTMINGLALRDTFTRLGIPSAVLSARAAEELVEPFDRSRAIRLLEEGTVVVFVAGTGNPFFTTDTAAALRAAQISADVLLKGTKVDGVYDGDPVKNPGAVKFNEITFDEALARGLRVMDAAAFAMCRDNGVPIVVFDMTTGGTLPRIIDGESLGTVVKQSAEG